MEARNLLTYPTWERYTILAHTIANLSVRERRLVFQVARSYQTAPPPDLFFPHQGFTLSEFAVWNTLKER